MRIISLITLTILIMISCKSNDINPSEIIGKWDFTGLTQSQNADGSWTPWRVNPTLLKTTPSIYEFTNEGNFLINGQSGANCCDFGSKFRIISNEIIFSDFLICPAVKCGKTQNWIIIEIKDDTLILEKYSIRNKYVRIK
jgi:hypothetical protein